MVAGLVSLLAVAMLTTPDEAGNTLVFKLQDIYIYIYLYSLYSFQFYSCHLCGRARGSEGTRVVREYVERLCAHAAASSSRHQSTAESPSRRDSADGVEKYDTRVESSPPSKNNPAVPGSRAEIINMKFKTKLCKQWVDGGT